MASGVATLYQDVGKVQVHVSFGFLNRVVQAVGDLVKLPVAVVPQALEHLRRTSREHSKFEPVTCWVPIP